MARRAGMMVAATAASASSAAVAEIRHRIERAQAVEKAAEHLPGGKREKRGDG